MYTEKTIPLQIRVDIELLEHIKDYAREQSFKKHKDVDWRDLIREAIAEKYPLPKQK